MFLRFDRYSQNCVIYPFPIRHPPFSYCREMRQMFPRELLPWLAMLVFELEATLLDETAFRLKLLLLLLRLFTLLLMLMTSVTTAAANEA